MIKNGSYFLYFTFTGPEISAAVGFTANDLNNVPECVELTANVIV